MAKRRRDSMIQELLEKCCQHADRLLKKETALTCDEAKAVRNMVESIVQLEALNLAKEERSRYAVREPRDRVVWKPQAKSSTGKDAGSEQSNHFQHNR